MQIENEGDFVLLTLVLSKFVSVIFEKYKLKNNS